MVKKVFVPLIVSVLVVFVLFTPVIGAPVSGKPIKIGIIGPMDIRTGNHLFISAQMAADKINATGGVKVGNTKRPIELVKISSNEFKRVADAVAAAERAITGDKVDFLIGGIVNEAVSAIQDIAADNKTIYINLSYIVSSKYVERMQKDYDRYKYCFAIASMDTTDIAKAHLGISETVAKAVQKATGEPKARVAQMVEKTASGDAIMGLTTAYFPKMGMEIVGQWRPSPSASDLRAETAAIKSSNPQMIYTVFSGPGGVVFGAQMAELKIPAIVVGSPAASLFPGKGIQNSVTMMSPATIPVKITDKNLAFYEEFLKRSGGELCVMSAHDTIMNLMHNIELVGSLNAEALIKSMEVQEYDGIGGPVKYDPKDHRSIMLRGYKPVYGVQQLPGGKAAIVWPEDAAVKANPVQIPQWMLSEWKKSK
jgi:branched-chain amino acid transport system substrate-binding protein